MQTDRLKKTLVQGEYFRVYPISKLTRGLKDNELVLKTRDLKEGLAIERKIDSDKYIVIAFIRPNITLEDVNFRTIDILRSNNPKLIYEYINCVDFAKQALIDILGEDAL